MSIVPLCCDVPFLDLEYTTVIERVANFRIPSYSSLPQALIQHARILSIIYPTLGESYLSIGRRNVKRTRIFPSTDTLRLIFLPHSQRA